MRVAAIGIGSNSLRMLVADVDGGRLLRLDRYREGLRVFAALDRQGNIVADMIGKACQSVETFRRQAAAEGAEQIHLFATSAVRDAANQAAFSQALLEATGLSLEICSGALEAKLSFLGATDGEPSGLIDIGGGSTEIVVGRGMEIQRAVSLQMGAVRLYRCHPIQSVEEAHAAVRIARELIAPERPAFAAIRPPVWVGVGGTFTTTAALVQEIPWNQRSLIHGFSLTQERVLAAMETLAPMPMEKRLALPSLQPQRSDIVVHGIAILLACMQELDLPAITVSEYGNLEGYLKVKYLYGGQA
ncbi:MAG: hypothetical protein KHX34_00895 [Clostridiales bacterium]|nr:hypothetical protein [Clostridiales bacterium]